MKKLLLALPILALILAVLACEGGPASSGDPYQDLRNAEATNLAARGAIEARDRTAQANMVRATEWINQVTLAARQTQDTYVLERLNAQATDVARQTATAWPPQATQTQDAWNAIAAQRTAEARVYATQTQATLDDLTRQQERKELEARREKARLEWEARLAPVKEIVPVIFWIAITILFVVGLVVSYRRFAPVLEIIGRSRPRDSVIAYKDRVIDAARSVAPVIFVDPVKQEAKLGGMAPLPAQMQITSQAQMVDAVRAMPRDHRSQQRVSRILKLVGWQKDPLPQLPAPPQVEVIDPDDDTDVTAWLREVNRKDQEEEDE